MPVFELLELRAMLTGNTYSPLTSVADSTNPADNNLRSAITAANADPGTQPDAIQLSSGSYTLTLGELEITNTAHTLIIEGQGSSGPNATIIDQTAIDRVYQVDADVTVIFRNVELTGGLAETDSSGGSTEADGGGLLSAGNVTLDGVQVDHNRALENTAGENASGGGIYSTGTLTIEGGSSIDYNRTDAATGPAVGTGGYAYGGGIFTSTDDSVAIDDATINNNAAAAGAGAPGIAAVGNTGGTAYGGGVYINNTATSSVFMNDDVLTANSADGGDGGNGDTGFNGGVAGFAQGAGVCVATGPTTISGTTLYANVVNGGTGGTGTTYGLGGFAFGGGAEINGTGSQLLNDTIYGNSAIGGSGSTSGNSFGGAVNDDSGGLTFVNVTAAANASSAVAPVAGGTAGTTQAGGINNYLGNDPALDLYNTLDATNTATVSPDFNGTAAIAVANFIGDGTGAVGFGTPSDDNQVGTGGSPLDPDFAVAGLVNNGGNTPTIALTSSSTALGAGNVAAAIAAGLTTDQRGVGFARIVSNQVDIGALEAQLHMATVTGATTTENTQTTSGLVITPAAADAAAVTNFQITGITGGTLFQADGTTPIANGDFITVAQGAAGLKFTPTTGSLTGGSFTVQESTSAAVGGLGGSTATATITVSLAGPTVTGAATTENTQTTSGLVIKPGTNDSTATNFQITGITGGTLYQNDGTTPITNGSFITLAQGAAGLKFTPATGSLAGGSFSIQESTTNAVGGLSGPTITVTIPVSLAGPTVTGATTTENTQTTSGLVIKPGTNDSTAAYFQITGITGGTLYQNDGTTPITNGSFLTLAQGAAGLKFTPTTGSLSGGSFSVQESTTNVVGGLSGATATGTIHVALSGPAVTSATTTENTQTTSGLVITPGVNDSTAAYFQITGITGGTLYQNNGTTPITNGSFITVAQGAAGLKFTPTTGSLSGGSFSVQESTTNVVGGLSGATATGTIHVALSGPAVTGATTTENTQTTSGLMITPGVNDSTAAYFQITGITGGTLYQNNGTTPITNGSFITAAQGAAGLKFTPTTGSLTGGSFSVQESTTNAAGGLSGPTVAAAIAVRLSGPAVTSATTTENTQTTSGLVITPGANDSTAAYFQITGITGGTLYQNNGTTPITSGSFITVAQGEAGLKFTATTGSLATGSFIVQESTTNVAGGLSGATATGTIHIALSGPAVTSALTVENTQTTSGLVITPGVNDSTAAYFQITGITGGTLYQNNGTTPIANGAFITAAQGAAGLKFTPTPGSLATGSFLVQESTTSAAGGLSGQVAAGTIIVALPAPVVTPSGTTQTFTIGGPAVAVDSGLTVTSDDTDLTGATMTINNVKPGDTLHFVSQNGIIGNYTGGVLTLSGSATPAQYTAALQSVTFSTTSTSTVLRSISIVALDTHDTGDVPSNSAAESVNVMSAATVVGPSVTNASTTENTQTTSGLVITPGAGDNTAAYFQITGITGGTLYQNNGTTQIPNGSFITLAQGAAGLKFTPNTGSLAAGSFTVQESTTASGGGLIGPTAQATISVSLAGPTVTGATTTENTQTTSGLVITPGAGDSTAAYFQITGILNGTVYQNDGTTVIPNGSFITLAQGEAGLKFTPAPNYVGTSSFKVQESTTNSPSGLNGPTTTVSIITKLAGPTVTGATTTENTQTTSGLVLKPGAGDTTAEFFQITGIAGGTLYENDGTTVIANGSFIALSEGEAGLKFTPTPGLLGAGSFAVREALTNTVGSLSGSAATAAIAVTLSKPRVTNTTTPESAQSTSGLVITSGPNDSSAAYYQITYITGGTLYQNNGTTQITPGSFITLAQGEAGLKFTPNAGSLVPGGFTIRQSTTASVSGLSGPTARAAIAVTLAGPNVTGTTTTENTQSTSGLVITLKANDSSAAYFQITGITGGTLYQNDGTTTIANGSFITLAQGAAGLKFTPTANSVTAGSFLVQESTTNAASGLSGATVKATIAVTLAGPNVTNATTAESTQTTSGLVITPGASDTTAAYYQITYITGGTLYQNDGATQITSGSYITLAQGEAGLKFTPNAGSLVPGGFSIRESTTGTVLGLSGPTARAAITVTSLAPSVTTATTTENAQTTSGLVITPGAGDTSAAFFQITSITGGTLYLNDGTTQITSGSFITAAQGAAGLKFTPSGSSLVAGGFTVQASTTDDASGLNGPTTRAVIDIAVAPTQSINLSNYYNLIGITNNGSHYGGGLDGAGNALSETKVGASQTWNGVNFVIAPAGANNVLQAAGQTIPLPDASYSKLELLGAAVNGNQPGTTFTVNYTDGSSQTYTQSVSDWHTPQSYAGESVVVSSDYRNTYHGGRDYKGPFDVYGYAFTLDSTKSVASITLPTDSHIEVLAIDVVAILAPPTDLTATVEGTSEVDLLWVGAGGSVTGYDVYRGTTAGGESTTPINSSPLSATATSYADTTVQQGNTYFYVVKALDGDDVSPASNEATASLPILVTAGKKT
jgi:hypothetical protein